MSTEQPIQLSASVVLLDPARGSGEPFGVFLLRRSQQSSFMPARFVFPGGRVEAEDGPDSGDLETLRRCALRELWEEAGVLLARGADGRPLTPAALQGLSRAGADRGAELAARGLSWDTEALRPWARWITPAARAKRFDTYFFLAAMPPGQEASADRQETSQGLWLGPRQALAENLAGRVKLAPPQVRLLGELAACDGVDALWRAPVDLRPVRPRLWLGDGARVVLLPWDRDYAAAEPGPSQACPAHQASRLVDREGRWLPHRA